MNTWLEILEAKKEESRKMWLFCVEQINVNKRRRLRWCVVQSIVPFLFYCLDVYRWRWGFMRCPYDLIWLLTVVCLEWWIFSRSIKTWRIHKEIALVFRNFLEQAIESEKKERGF